MKKSYYLKIYYFFYIIGFVFLIANESLGQAISIGGGNPTLTITTGIPDGQLVSVVNTNCTMQYRRQGRISKITVETSCPNQSFNLSVVATNVTAVEGTAQPAVNLINGNPAMDFIRDNPTTGRRRTCTLNYTASATFDQGCSTDVGNDVHRVTYTILAQ